MREIDGIADCAAEASACDVGGIFGHALMVDRKAVVCDDDQLGIDKAESLSAEMFIYKSLPW